MAPTRRELISCFIGANLVSLGGGTTYVYSFYAPQLLARCKIPISQSSTLSFAITIGSSALGLLVGYIIDKFGPQITCLFGTIATFSGYFILYQCYLHQYSLIYLLSAALILVGVGSISGFYGSVKCCTTNFPEHRGTAAALPVAFYALAGVIYSSFCKWYYNDDILGVFRFFMFFCSSLIFVGCFTMKVYDPAEVQVGSSSPPVVQPVLNNRNSHLRDSASEHRISYDSLLQSNNNNSSSSISNISKPMSIKQKRTDSAVWSKELVGSLAYWGWGKVRDSPGNSDYIEIGSSSDRGNGRGSFHSTPSDMTVIKQGQRPLQFPGNSSMVNDSAIDLEESNNNNGNDESDLLHRQHQTHIQQQSVREPSLKDVEAHSSTRDIPLKNIIISKKFISYYLILATLQGIGQMYIYSVGFLVTTQIASHPDSLDLNQESIQSLQVCLIAIMSFVGRLSSGPISDLLVKKFKAQRKWNIFLACMLMAATSFYTYHDPSLVSIESQMHLQKTPDFVVRISISSILFGLAFGITFGTFPATLADAFGTLGFSTLWGLSTTGGLFSVKFFSAVLANDLSRNSKLDDTSDEGTCTLGTLCYMHTFKVTMVFALLAATLSLYMILVKYRYKKARLDSYKRKNSIDYN